MMDGSKSSIEISIHALLAESDHFDNYNLHCVEISIHALLAESDYITTTTICIVSIFLSTLSLRRATTRPIPAVTRVANFYPRSPCGERRYIRSNVSNFTRISIHALLAESDERANRLANAPPHISIHALLAESDRRPLRNGHHPPNFYPRSPCGERQLNINRTTETIVFLSTLSLRRATRTWLSA